MWTAPSPTAVSSVVLHATGQVRPTLDPRSVGIFEALYSSIKPLDVLGATIDMVPTPRMLPASVSLPFEFPVEPLPGCSLTETYHGVYVTVKYAVEVSVSLAGGFGLGASVRAEAEFVVEVPQATRAPPAPVEFELRPESLENVRREKVTAIPRFHVRGRLSKTNCSLSAPFTGELTVVASEARIRSVELQLVRVETITYAEGQAREATEIQNLQIGDGDVPRGLAIPLYMIFPRIFTCPTSISDSFRVEFEVNIIVVFEDSYMVTENFPIRLYRAPVGAAVPP